MLKLFSKNNIRLVDYIIELSNSKIKSRAHINKLIRLAKLIREFEKDANIIVNPDSFDDATSERLLDFIKSTKAMRGNKSYKAATVRSFIEQIKSVLNRMSRAGYKVNTDGLKGLNIRVDESSAVYLTMTEIEALNNLTLSANLAQIRDLFVIGCLTGLRYSDYSRLTEDNFISGNIEITTRKTNTRVVVPIHPIVDGIIQRNGGYRFLDYKKNQQNFNMRIKGICKKAGITDKIYSESNEGKKKVKRVIRKYELISSHTARRSFATNMYIAGVSAVRIMLITGHKTEEAFFTYIRINKEENASELKNHPFFR